jgi:hypothetical protein
MSWSNGTLPKSRANSFYLKNGLCWLGVVSSKVSLSSKPLDKKENAAYTVDGCVGTGNLSFIIKMTGGSGVQFLGDRNRRSKVFL